MRETRRKGPNPHPSLQWDCVCLVLSASSASENHRIKIKPSHHPSTTTAIVLALSLIPGCSSFLKVQLSSHQPFQSSQLTPPMSADALWVCFPLTNFWHTQLQEARSPEPSALHSSGQRSWRCPAAAVPPFHPQCCRSTKEGAGAPGMLLHTPPSPGAWKAAHV